MRWTADEISTLFPSGLRDFQHFKTPEYDIAEKIGRFTFIMETDQWSAFKPYTHPFTAKSDGYDLIKH
jgi:hypothetical protein